MIEPQIGSLKSPICNSTGRQRGDFSARLLFTAHSAIHAAFFYELLQVILMDAT